MSTAPRLTRSVMALSLSLSLALAWPVTPARAAGDDPAAMAGQTQLGSRTLRLHGAGVATRALWIKVYSIGLYLADGSPHDSTQPRRLAITMLRDVCGADFLQALDEALAVHAPPAQRAGFSQQVARMGELLLQRGCSLRRGDRLALDWWPGRGTVIELNGSPLGAPVAEPGFYDALLSIWIGPRPADPALKQALLGRATEVRAGL